MLDWRKRIKIKALQSWGIFFVDIDPSIRARHLYKIMRWENKVQQRFPFKKNGNESTLVDKNTILYNKQSKYKFKAGGSS